MSRPPPPTPPPTTGQEVDDADREDNAARLARIAAQLAAGTYLVDVERIADRLLLSLSKP